MRRFIPFVLAALLAAGCGSAAPAPAAPPAEPAAPAAPPPETDPVKWTERVCDAMGPFIQAGDSLGDVEPDQNDPAAAVTALKEQFQQTDAAIGETLTALDAVGPSPVADGDVFVEEMSKFLGNVQTAFKKVGEATADIDPAAPDAQEKVQAALAPLNDVPPPDDSKIGKDSEIAKLLGQSPKCEKLGAVVG